MSGYVRPSIDDGRVDQIAILDAVEQGVAKGGLSTFAAEGAIGVEQEAPFGITRVAGRGTGLAGTLQIVAGRCGQPELVAHEEVEHRAGVAANRTVCFVGDYQVEIGRGKKMLVLVVEQERLDGGDDDLGMPPVITAHLIDDRPEVGRKQGVENLVGLIFQFQPVDQEEHTAGIARAQEQLDDGGGGKRLAGAGGHLEQKTVMAIPRRPLQRMDGLELIGAQKSQCVGPNETRAFALVLPRCFRSIVRPLGENDIVVVDPLFNQTLRVRRDLPVVGYRVRRRERGDNGRSAALQIPEVVQIAVRQDHKAAMLRAGVFACLLLPDKRVLVLRLGFKNDAGKSLGVEKQEVDVPLGGLLEVVA